MKQIIAIAVIVLLCITVVSFLRQSTPEAASGKGVLVPAVKVSVQTLEPRDYRIVLRAFGNIEPEQRYQLHALVGGQVVRTSDAFKAGRSVARGDMLLELDQSDYVLAVAEAKTQLASAKLALKDEEARAEQAERDWNKRNERSIARDFVLRKPHLEAARAQVESAEAALEHAERDLRRTQVLANFDGVIESVTVNPGAVITPSTNLGVGFPNRLGEIRLAIAAGDLRFLRFDSDAEAPEITLFNRLVEPKQSWEGRYLRTEPSIDPQSQQIFIVVGVDQPFTSAPDGSRNALLAGQYLSAEIRGSALNDVIVVPNELIYQGSYVYLVEGGEAPTLRRADISILHRGEAESVIGEGLKAGDVLVTTVLGQLASGTRLEITE